MPFDMSPTVETEKHLIFKRLCVLRELLPRSRDQASWHTCLWSEAKFSEALHELGVKGMTDSPSEEDHKLFGLNAAFYFCGSDVSAKAYQLNEDIAALERELSTV